MQESRCFSKTLKQFVESTDDQVGTDCEGATGAQLVMCPDPLPCPTEPFFKYSPFGACDATCDISTCPLTERRCMVPGNKTREYECMMDDAVEGLVPVTNCTDTPEELMECAKTCTNTLPRFIKTVGECVQSGCDLNGTVTTTYTPCTGGRGCKRYPEFTTSTAFVQEETCPGFSCDPCADVPCLAENTLNSTADTSSGQCLCECADGFMGSRCHLAAGQAYTILDSSGMACASGVADIMGNCCDEGVAIDGCGYCANIEVEDLSATRVGYDLDGQCCSSSSSDVLLTGDFTCCESIANLDECGVCNGSGETCKKIIDGIISSTGGGVTGDFSDLLELSLPTTLQDLFLKPGEAGNPARRRLQQTNVDEAVTYILSPGSSMSAVELAGSFIIVGMDASSGTSPLLSGAPDAPSPSLQGVPGDEICGTGETPENSPNDCIEAQSCPQPVTMSSADFGNVFVGSPTLACSSNGQCLSASGTCMCNPGYIGDACDQCDGANGYSLLPTSVDPPVFACTTLSQDFPPGPPSPPGVNPPAGGTPSAPTTRSTTESSKKGLGMGALIGIIVGAVGGVVIIAGAAFFVLRMRAGKEVSPV